MVPLEGGWRSQLWRTVRSLALAFVVLSGVGAIMEDRGLGKGEGWPLPNPLCSLVLLAAVPAIDIWELPMYSRSPCKNFVRMMVLYSPWRTCRQAAHGICTGRRAPEWVWVAHLLPALQGWDLTRRCSL